MAFDKDHDGLKREYSANLQSFGQNGFRIVGSTQVDGDFVAITALEDSTVSFGIPVGMAADDGTIALPTGLTIYGKFTTVTALSGKVIAYTLTEG